MYLLTAPMNKAPSVFTGNDTFSINWGCTMWEQDTTDTKHKYEMATGLKTEQSDSVQGQVTWHFPQLLRLWLLHIYVLLGEAFVSDTFA